MDEPQTDQQKLDEADLLPSITRAATVNAEKDQLTVEALLQVRRSRKIMYVVAAAMLVGLGYLGIVSNDQASRSTHNTNLLVCVATSQQDVAKDIKTLITSKGKAPSSAYKIPAGCQLVQ